MKRKIHCTSCGRHCGEIRDASLLKGLKFMCGPCDLRRDLRRDLDAGNSDLIGKVLGSLNHKSESRSTKWIDYE